MYSVGALFDITVPFFVFAPPNENTFRRPWPRVDALENMQSLTLVDDWKSNIS